MRNKLLAVLILSCCVIASLLYILKTGKTVVQAQNTTNCAIQMNHGACSNTVPEIPGGCPVPSGFSGGYPQDAPPACGTACAPGASLRCPIECPNCGFVEGSNGTYKCGGAPTPTPLICGSVCTNSLQCPTECPSCQSSGMGFSQCGHTPPAPTQAPTPAVVCGADCSTNPNVCANLAGCNYCNPTSQKCEAVPTATPTPAVVCGASCATNPNICANLAGCNYCNPTYQKCEAQPTATPTPAPVCGADCSTNPNVCANLAGCNYCNPTSKKCEAQPAPTSTPMPTSTPAPTSTPVPTATPTPTPFPFDESMCSCDGIDYTPKPIITGSDLTVTAFGKVLGVNKNYAKIPTMTFTFYQGNGVVVNVVKKDTVNTTVSLDTAEKTQYQAIWALNIPSNIDTSQTYRIQAHLDCSRKTAGAFINTNRVVLAATTSKPSFWDSIASFFAGLFGIKTQTSHLSSVSSSVTPTLTAQQRKNLQLQTFTPAKGVSTDNCTFIKFNF